MVGGPHSLGHGNRLSQNGQSDIMTLRLRTSPAVKIIIASDVMKNTTLKHIPSVTIFAYWSYLNLATKILYHLYVHKGSLIGLVLVIGQRYKEIWL